MEGLVGLGFLILFFLIMSFATKNDIERFDESKDFLIVAFAFFIIFIFYFIKEFKWNLINLWLKQ